MIEAYLSYFVIDETPLEEKLVNEVKDIRPALLLVQQSFKRFPDIGETLLTLEQHMPFHREERRIVEKLTENIEGVVIIQGPNWSGNTKLAIEVVFKKIRHLQKSEKNLKVIIVSKNIGKLFDDLLPLKKEGIAVEFVPFFQQCLPQLHGNDTQGKRILLMNESFRVYGPSYDWCVLKNYANTDWVLNLKDDDNVEDSNEDDWIKKDGWTKMILNAFGKGRKRNPSTSPLTIDVEFCKPKNFRLDTNCYPMTKELRGMCLIIDVVKFENHSTRFGSAVDSQYLKKLFSDLNFHVILEEDPKYQDISIIMEQFQLMHKDNNVDMCSVFVLSHGDRGEVINPDETIDNGSFFFTSDDKMVKPNEIMLEFFYIFFHYRSRLNTSSDRSEKSQNCWASQNSSLFNVVKDQALNIVN